MNRNFAKSRLRGKKSELYRKLEKASECVQSSKCNALMFQGIQSALAISLYAHNNERNVAAPCLWLRNYVFSSHEDDSTDHFIGCMFGDVSRNLCFETLPRSPIYFLFRIISH